MIFPPIPPRLLFAGGALVVLLAGGWWYGHVRYSAGRADVQALWDADKAVVTTALLDAAPPADAKVEAEGREAQARAEADGYPADGFTVCLVAEGTADVDRALGDLEALGATICDWYTSADGYTYIECDGSLAVSLAALNRGYTLRS
jgi:hypothetical protein